jgi:hypothetical protein
MKKYILIFAFFSFLLSYGQVRVEQISFNKLVEVKGTDNIIALEVNTNSLGDINSMNIIFIDTKNGKTTSADIGKEYIIQDFKQIKIDDLNINTIIVAVRLFDIDNNARINLKDPITLVSVGTDGKSKHILTDTTFNVRVWEVNEKTGTLVVAGYYDNNRNGRFDPQELNEIQIFDLFTFKHLYKLQ